MYAVCRAGAEYLVPLPLHRLVVFQLPLSFTFYATGEDRDSLPRQPKSPTPTRHSHVAFLTLAYGLPSGEVGVWFSTLYYSSLV